MLLFKHYFLQQNFVVCTPKDPATFIKQNFLEPLFSLSSKDLNLQLTSNDSSQTPLKVKD
jgi:hypothetical protein